MEGQIGTDVFSFISCYSFLSICMIKARLTGDVYNWEVGVVSQLYSYSFRMEEVFVNNQLWEATRPGQRGREEKQEVGEGQKQEVGARPSPYKRAGLFPLLWHFPFSYVRMKLDSFDRTFYFTL